MVLIGFSTVVLQLYLASQKPNYRVPNERIEIRSANESGFDLKQACQFPILNPFDPSILSYIKHPPPISCRNIQPEFTYTDGHFMKINFTLADQYRLSISYRNIIARDGVRSITYENWIVWNINATPTIYLKEPVEVIGEYLPNYSHPLYWDTWHVGTLSKSYNNLHSSIHLDKEILKKSSPQQEIPHLNILIIGFESTSRSNFIRNLPLTYDLLINRMKSIDFRGYTKVGDNTISNICAVWTGYLVTWPNDELGDRNNLDHFPFIWKNFPAKGYVTGLAEEQLDILFYDSKGVKNKPVDWHFRPLSLALENSPLRKESSPYCVGNRPISRILYDSMYRFLIDQHKNRRPHFLFSFVHKISHGRVNDIETLDFLISNFFQHFVDNGYFNNTLLIVMGDHGNRFDDICRTLIGRYEERMLYLSVYAPPWFREKFPSAVENLKTNAWRLTCNFDIYETMVDILLNEINNEKRQRLKNRGYSLFSSIPKSRTCEQAGIHPHFCVCQQEIELDIQNSNVISAAKFALDTINLNYLAQHPFEVLCVKLILKSIKSAQKYQANENVKYNVRINYGSLELDKNVSGIISHIRVTFSTEPNNGIYEAVVQYYSDAGDGKEVFKPNNVEISRINAYGNAGDCVKKINNVMAKFCFCKVNV